MSPRKRAATPKPVDFHDKLLEALSEVDRPGDFCTWGDRPLVMPGLEADRMGVVGLPLTKTHARKLTKLCRQAPYGKGTETVVDTDDLLTEEANGDRLAAFRLPPEKQNRLELLLKKNADGSMSADERGELEEYERLEHLGRMLKARLRQKKKP